MRLDRTIDALGDFVLPDGGLQLFEERHPLLSNLRPIDLLDSQYGAEATIGSIERAATGSFP